MDEWARSSYLKRREQQVADAEAVLIQDPAQPEVREWLAMSCNDLAWALITGPDSRRESGPGAPSGTPRLALKPDGPGFLNTLGLALYRVGRYHEAICAIERSLATNQTESTSHDLFILSLCHARQADLAQSRSYFDRAVSRRNSHGAGSTREDQELKELGDEADAAIRASVPDLPADVFSPEPVGPPDR